MRKNLLMTTALVAACVSFAHVLPAVANTTIDFEQVVDGSYDGRTFFKQRSGKGGVMVNEGTLTLNNVNFSENTANNKGGAILNKGLLTVQGSKFHKNTANGKGKKDGGGGAIYVNAKEAELNVLNSEFDENSAPNTGGKGGAIHVQKGKLLNVSDSVFTNNTAKKEGGAIYFEGVTPGGTPSVFNISGSTFKHNSAKTGGAIYSYADESTVDHTLFEENYSKQEGGAIGFNGKKMNVQDSVFKTNTSSEGGAIYSLGNKLNVTNTVFLNNAATEGGAIDSAGKKMRVDNSLFENNTATGDDGGAIYSMNDKLKVKNSTFKNNHAEYDGGAIYFNGGSSKGKLGMTVRGVLFANNSAVHNGGAVDVYRSTAKFVDSKFVNNTAGNKGAALFVSKGSDVTFKGNNIFQDNYLKDDPTQKNDIHLAGKKSSILVGEGENVGNLILDGGITGAKGKVTVNNGSVLTVRDTSKVESNVEGDGHIHVVITDETMQKNKGKLNLAGSEGIFTKKQPNQGGSSAGFSRSDSDPYNVNVDKMFGQNDNPNNLYQFVKDTAKSGGSYYTVTERSVGEVAGRLGVKNNEAETLLAVSSSASNSGNTAFNDIQNTLRLEAQYGTDSTMLSQAADALAADVAPVVRVRETMLNNMIFDTASDALDDNISNAAVEQKDSLLDRAKIWVKGLFNTSDQDDTDKAHGFDIDTYGIAMGVDKNVNENTKVGIGYAYSQSDIDGYTRDTDVDTHSLFVYGKYQPADWYVKGMASYSWSDYEESKSVLGYNADSKYDVNTLAMEGLYGYNFHMANDYEITPEAGLRYMRISQDAGTNAVGTKVKSQDADVLTAIVGVKAKKEFTFDNGMIIKPEVRVAATYDLASDDNDSTAVLANGEVINIKGEEMDKFGVELGAKVATDISANWEIGAGYEGRFREDYTDHTAMLNAKYKF